MSDWGERRMMRYLREYDENNMPYRQFSVEESPSSSTLTWEQVTIGLKYLKSGFSHQNEDEAKSEGDIKQQAKVSEPTTMETDAKQNMCDTAENCGEFHAASFPEDDKNMMSPESSLVLEDGLKHLAILEGKQPESQPRGLRIEADNDTSNEITHSAMNVKCEGNSTEKVISSELQINSGEEFKIKDLQDSSLLDGQSSSPAGKLREMTGGELNMKEEVMQEEHADFQGTVDEKHKAGPKSEESEEKGNEPVSISTDEDISSAMDSESNTLLDGHEMKIDDRWCPDTYMTWRYNFMEIDKLEERVARKQEIIAALEERSRFPSDNLVEVGETFCYSDIDSNRSRSGQFFLGSSNEDSTSESAYSDHQVEEFEQNVRYCDVTANSGMRPLRKQVSFSGSYLSWRQALVRMSKMESELGMETFVTQETGKDKGCGCKETLGLGDIPEESVTENEDADSQVFKHSQDKVACSGLSNSKSRYFTGCNTTKYQPMKRAMKVGKIIEEQIQTENSEKKDSNNVPLDESPGRSNGKFFIGEDIED